MITTKHKITAIKREIGMREIVYPKRVAKGAMKQFEANRELDIMRAILADYEAIAEREAPNQPSLF